ncbi:MAG: thiamine-phosphate kinase [Cephaloticoccus sp.]
MHPFTRKSADSVAAWGETALLGAIRRWLGDTAPAAPFGMGDDCAVLPMGARLVTVDPVIYGRHFDDQVSARDAGAKLLKRNLSDLAAMGGRPTGAVIALALDPRTRRDWLEPFYRGLAAAARRYQVPIVGGDVAEGPGINASLTLLGEPAGQRVLTRTGAGLHDHIFVTGVLGGSLASGHHHRFTPRLAEGAWLARQAAVRSMMDVSDGLAKDLQSLTPSGLFPAIAADQLPRRRGVDVAGALSDGEDYELLFTLAARTDAKAFARRWRAAFPRTRLTCLGRFERAGSHDENSLRLECYHGFEHLH